MAEVQKYLSGMLGKNNNNIVLFLSDALCRDVKRFLNTHHISSLQHRETETPGNV